MFSVWIFGCHGWSVLLPQVIEGTAAVFLLHRTVGRWAGEHVALLAVLWLVAAAYALTRALSGLVLAGVTLLVVPSVWSGATAFAATRSGGAMAQAGPTEPRRGFEPGGLTAQDQRILAYVSKAAPNARIRLALEEPSMQAAQWIIGSDLTVIGMGGFAGTDGAPTTAQLADWVRTGQLRPADARFRPERDREHAARSVGAAALRGGESVRVRRERADPLFVYR